MRFYKVGILSRRQLKDLGRQPAIRIGPTRRLSIRQTVRGQRGELANRVPKESSHEPKESCGLSSHIPKKITEGRPRALAGNPEQAGASCSGGQHNEADLFAGWFTDRQENFDNAVYQGVSSPLNLNVSINQGLSLSRSQEAPPQQFFALQEQMRFMREQMAT
ncbi:hypothetical protein J1N35_037876 [Gossypium stocksii]|uniref:Uncharacterized protein n=1 Tax=Gossypium stocksii TaxID=47602 RepID=A0A9D3UL05_9ROSI|nr:hypothetical protein J1N35_037876 [Gossypium stocksii]